MANKEKKAKVVLPTIDTILGNTVSDYNGWALLNLGTVALGAKKVKAVLDNIPAATEFVAKYWKPETTKVVTVIDKAATEKLQAENATLMAELAALKAKLPKKVLARFTPATPAAVAA